MTRNLLTKLRATNSWPPNGTVPANGAAYPGVAAQKIFYNERSGVPAQPSSSPDRAAGAQGAGPVPLTLASGPQAGEPAAGEISIPGVTARTRRPVVKPPRHLADLPMAGRRAAIAE